MTETMGQPFRVLLATDASDEALNAEAWVSRLRWDRPCEIAVLCVATYGVSRLGWLREGDLSSGRTIMEQLRMAEVIAAETTANEAGLRLQHPVDAALQSAERIDPDLIIVPRQHQGHDPFGEKIARYAKTTVVIAPEP